MSTVAAAGVAWTAAIFAATEPIANPTVSPPVAGGRGQPFGALSAADLSQSRYTETEYFFGGTATAYDKDGVWLKPEADDARRAAEQSRLGR